MSPSIHMELPIDELDTCFTVYNQDTNLNYCNSVDIVFLSGWEDEQILRFSKIVRELSVILPNWVNTVYMGMEKDNCEDEYTIKQASCVCLYSYRYASINIYPRLLEMPDDEVYRIMTHEFCHIIVSPLVNHAHGIASEDPNQVDIIIDKTEEVTTDLEDVLCRLLAVGPKPPSYRSFVNELGYKIRAREADEQRT